MGFSFHCNDADDDGLCVCMSARLCIQCHTLENCRKKGYSACWPENQDKTYKNNNSNNKGACF